MLLTAEEQHEVEQFLYMEAALLDERRYAEWLDLFAVDCHYWMPIRQTRLSGQDDLEFTKPGEMAFFDDTKDALAIRVKKLESSYAWGESPPPRTRHTIANVRAIARDEALLTVSSNITFWRTSLDRDIDCWVGRREDVLRRDGSSFAIVERSIFLDQTVILSKNMSNLF